MKGLVPPLTMAVKLAITEFKTPPPVMLTDGAATQVFETIGVARKYPSSSPAGCPRSFTTSHNLEPPAGTVSVTDEPRGNHAGLPAAGGVLGAQAPSSAP